MAAERARCKATKLFFFTRTPRGPKAFGVLNLRLWMREGATGQAKAQEHLYSPWFRNQKEGGIARAAFSWLGNTASTKNILTVPGRVRIALQYEILLLFIGLET